VKLRTYALTELSNARCLLPPSTMLLTLISALTCSVRDLRELVTDPFAPSSLLYPSASSWTLTSLLFDFGRPPLAGAAETLRGAYSE